MGFSVGTSVVPFPIPNEQFLAGVFGDHWPEALVTYFPGDPKPSNPLCNWQSYPAGQVLRAMHAGLNNYYDVSLPVAGGARTGADFGALYAIVLDDCGTKVDIDKAIALLGRDPNYVIETSPGNYQAGWFVEPIADRAWAMGLLRGLYRALGQTGDNLVKPVTLVRLPVGTNGKASLARNFAVRLVHWDVSVRTQALDFIEIEQRIGAVTPVDMRVDMSGGAMPDAAAIEDDAVLRVLRARGMVLDQGKTMNMGWGHEIVCPWAHEHTDPRTSAVYVPVKQRFKCHHGHCEQRSMADLRGWADAVVRDDSGGLVTLAGLEFDELAGAGPGTSSKTHGASIAWRNHWQRAGANGQGAPISNAANILVALELAPELSGSCGFDGFNLHETLLRELPGVGPGTTPGVPRAWRDVDTVILQCWLQRQGLATISTKMVDDVVGQVMHAHSYHPVRDWLEGLVWDQTKRLDTWIAKYLGAVQTPYTAHVGRWWLMTMCRRVFEPGCRADYMPVIEGAQGLEKSTALRVLAGAWFSDQLPDINHKDVSEHIIGRWLIEIAEMDRFDRTETAAMKAFVSRTTERYRRAYAKRTADEPRQGVFAGTVNHASYLKDETGNRRYWPVTAGAIDVPGLALVRDQLFAEAWHRAVVLNEDYWPDPVFEELFIQPEQDARLEGDPWEGLIEQHLATKTQVLVHEVMVAVTGGGSAQLNTTNRNRVVRIMETLGWRRGKRGPNGERFWRRD